MLYSCCDDRRREAVRHHPTLNGIDYLEIADDPTIADEQRLRTLYVHCIKPLNGHILGKENVSIEGGERIRDVAVTAVTIGKNSLSNLIIVQVNKPGDFSIYTLRLLLNVKAPNFDPLLTTIDFTFKTENPNDFDPKAELPCPPELYEQPEIDYLAKDFTGFRDLMLDRLTVLMPQWNERSPADIGVVLVELLAYVADYLSYQQDVIATESYLGTARRRVSMRRHARLLDYFISEGSNARTWVQVVVNTDVGMQSPDVPALPKGTRLLTQLDSFGTSIPSTSLNTALALQPTVFETMYDVDELYEAHNELHFYTWGARECCLPKGATKATLQGHLRNLKVGDILIFEEIFGPFTGAPEDADLTHRCAVRLTKVTYTTDPLGKWFMQTTLDSAPATFETVKIEEVREIKEVLKEKKGQEEVKISEKIEEKVEDAGKEEKLEIEEKDEEKRKHEAVEVVEDSRRRKAPKEELFEDKDSTVVMRAFKLEETIKEKGMRARLEATEKDVKESDKVEEVERHKGAVEEKDERAKLETRDAEIMEQEQDGKTTQSKETNYSLDITEIEWDIEDALPFPLCISATTAPEHGQQYIENISVARGNVILADHGLTIENEDLGQVPIPSAKLFKVPSQSGHRCQVSETIPILPRFYPSLKNTPLTHIGPAVNVDASANATLNWAAMNPGMLALPAIILQSTLQYENQLIWQAKPDLLYSDSTAPEFVVEIEADGTAYIRFGDGRHGLFPEPQAEFTATYRVGNGVQGNIGADSLVHIVDGNSHIVELRNPLPAKGGVEPESVEDVRQRASSSFLVQERAVTTDDYVDLVKRDPTIKRAAAVQRWSGSWYTTFLAVERVGGLAVDASFKDQLCQRLERYRMAGSDLQIVAPVYVSLEIEMTVKLQDDYFRNQLKAMLMDVFSNRILPDGTRGYFYLDNFSFGQPIYISPLRSAAMAVPGVDSVEIITFQRQGYPSQSGLSQGSILLDWMEIARLDNDPNFQEHGVFRLNVEGGK